MKNLITRLNQELGFTYIETLIALAVLGSIAVTFLSGVTMTSRTAYMYDVRETAASLAQRQIECIKDTEYNGDAEYSVSPIPDTEDYIGFSVDINAESLHTPDDGIQKISVVVSRYSEEILTLETFKVQR
jgi:type II secretory pathway pseudopilin PulG